MDHYEAGPKTPEKLDPPLLDGIDGYEEPAEPLLSDHDATGLLFACLEAIGEWVDLTVAYLDDEGPEDGDEVAVDLLQERWDEHFTAKWQVIELVGQLYREFVQFGAALTALKGSDQPSEPSPGQLILPGQE